MTDNANVRAWIKNGRPKNALARHLIWLLERLEANYGFMAANFFLLFFILGVLLLLHWVSVGVSAE